MIDEATQVAVDYARDQLRLAAEDARSKLVLHARQMILTGLATGISHAFAYHVVLWFRDLFRWL